MKCQTLHEKYSNWSQSLHDCTDAGGRTMLGANVERTQKRKKYEQR